MRITFATLQPYNYNIRLDYIHIIQYMNALNHLILLLHKMGQLHLGKEVSLKSSLKHFK